MISSIQILSNSLFTNHPTTRRMTSSEMWSHVDLMWTNVSEESIASILRVEKSASEEPAWAGGCTLHAGSLFADFSTLKMEAIRSSETSVHTRTTRRHIPEDSILQAHHHEKLKSYILQLHYTAKCQYNKIMQVTNHIHYNKIILHRKTLKMPQW
jgi:hypothetical protein